MGLDGATKAKWVGKGLSLNAIQNLQLGKRIDVDGNALAWTYCHQKGNKSLSEILSLMAQHLKQLAHNGGFIVTVIFDGTSRPDCKRASLKRRKQRFISDSNRMYCRLKLSQLKAKYQKDRCNETKKQLDEYSKECRKLEKACMKSLIIPENIATLFSERLVMHDACCPNDTGGYVDERVLTAVFQADSLIASRSMSNLNDFIYGNDADYFVLLGNKCMLLWNMKRVTSTKSFQVDIYGCCNVQLQELQSKLPNNQTNATSQIKWTRADYPLFASPDPYLRGLIALSMGCDVFDGISNFGISKINDCLNDSKKKDVSLTESLKKEMKDRMKSLDDNILDTLVSALLYEPGLVDTNLAVQTTFESNASTHENMIEPYIHTPPQGYQFPRFIESFSVQKSGPDRQSEVQPINSPSVCYCNGFGSNGSHMHLSFEGTHRCVECKHSFCKTCTFIPSNDIPKTTKMKPNLPIYYRDECNETLCLDCFKAKRFGEEKANDPDINMNVDVSIESMKRVLYERVGLQLTGDASIVEIMDMYETYVSSKSNTYDSIHHRLAKEKIKYPLFSSDSIKNSEVFKQVGETFHFSNGGRFMSDKSTVSDENIPKVLELFTSLLKHDEDLIPKGNESDQNKDIYIGKYEYLPSMFLHLAYHSRIDSGYRLLDRCARHTCDPKGGSLYYQNASFIEYIDNNTKEKGK